MYSTKKRAIIWLSLLWIGLRIYPALTGYAWGGGDIFAAHKLVDDYGFRRLHGGMVGAEGGLGIVAHPEHYVYTNHPYGLWWFYVALYYCFGAAGIIGAVFLLKYLAFLLCFLVLDQCFSRSAAFWASALYAAAPIFILTDGATNCVVAGSILWPIGLALIFLRFRHKETFSRGDLLLAGAATFLAGQAAWFAFSIAPSLAAINSRVTSFRPRAIRQVLTNPLSLAFLAGGALSLLVFLGQVAVFSNLAALIKYSVFKAGASSAATLPRLFLMGLIPLRLSVFMGFGLAFAALLGCVYLARNASLRNELAMGAVLYFIAFTAMALLAPRAFWEENHFYAWLVCPGAVMTAMLFEKIGSRLRSLILLAGGFGIVLALMYASVPLDSPMARYMGRTFAAHSKKTDFIFTNINPPGPPFKPIDVGANLTTKCAADRLIVFGVSDPGQLCVARDLVDEATGFQYWKLRSLPIGPKLEAELASRGKLVETITIALPNRKETLPEKLRLFFWYSVMKKGKRIEQASGSSSEVIDIYQIQLPDL